MQRNSFWKADSRPAGHKMTRLVWEPKAGSSVSIGLRMRVDILSIAGRGGRSCLLHRIDNGSWGHPVDVGVKWLGREVDHLPQSGKIKEAKPRSSGKN
jgi:hypothetical protein